MIKRMLTAFFILLCFFSSTAVSLADISSNLFSFADALFAEKDYYRAITEYKRIVHSHPDTPEARLAQYMIGLAYFRAEKWDSALAVFQDIKTIDSTDEFGKKAELMIAESTYRAGDFASSLDYFHSFIRHHGQDLRAIDAKMRVAQCFLMIGKEPLTSNQALSLAEDFPQNDRAITFSRELQSALPLPRKSPAFAGLLSAILPGAGQIYTQRPRDAGISFLLNAGFTAAAVIAFHNDEPVAGGILSLVELTWYTGNIYGAVNGAHKYNRTRLQQFIEKLDFQCGIMQDIDGNIVPVGEISFKF